MREWLVPPIYSERCLRSVCSWHCGFSFRLCPLSWRCCCGFFSAKTQYLPLCYVLNLGFYCSRWCAVQPSTHPPPSPSFHYPVPSPQRYSSDACARERGGIKRLSLSVLPLFAGLRLSCVPLFLLTFILHFMCFPPPKDLITALERQTRKREGPHTLWSTCTQER